MQRQDGADLCLHDVNKCFGDKQVLKDINLDIRSGQFVSVIGKSGCGKSTLLRLIAGLETPTSGEVLLDGESQHGISSHTKVMFQAPRLLPWKSVIDNIAIGLSKDNRHEAETALENVGLAAYRDSSVSSLSGGQAQRVALARALACSPRLLLLDEPLGALDALTRYEMQNLIHDIWERKHITVVLVTHDVDEAVYLSDRIIMIKDAAISLDASVHLPYPRDKAKPEFAEISGGILNTILGG